MHAEFVAEMVRQAIAEQYPEEVYTRGFRVYTTIRKADQEAAYAALRRGVLEYDRRHGYRGPEGYVELPANADEDDYDERSPSIRTATTCSPRSCSRPTPKQVQAALRTGEKIDVAGEGLRFAARALDAKTAPQKRIRRGAIIRVQRDEQDTGRSRSCRRWRRRSSSLDPQDGAVRALVGGFDFNRNKFNHVTQAWRQPGSSFKPFIYSASLEKGFTAGDRDRRRAGGARGRADRQPALGAEELRRQVRRPDAPAHRARQVEEHGLDPHPAGDRRRSTRRTT